MINYIDEEKIYGIVNETVMTVPGVSGFYKYNAHGPKKKIHSSKISANDYIKLSIENREKLFCEITIYLILFQLINIFDICQEIQIRIKHELEKLNLSKVTFTVNIIVKDIV